MEVLEMLKNNLEELTLDELDMLIDELNTGLYSQAYKEECLSIIHEEIKKRKTPPDPIASVEAEPTPISKEGDGQKVENPKKKTVKEMTKEELSNLLILYRTSSNVEEKITEWVANREIDADFLLKRYNEFSNQELICAFNLIKVPEDDLFVYLKALPKGTIERTQIISEDFFIKHYEDMNITALKSNRKNAWVIDPSQRSSKLIIFIKMKGIKI